MGLTVFVPKADMTMTAQEMMQGHFALPAADMELVPLQPSIVWAVAESDVVRRVYRCYLIGVDGLPDIELPLMSFSATMRSGSPSYLTCKIHNISEYEDEILLREGGSLVIRYGVYLRSGVEQLTEIARVNYETLQVNKTGTWQEGVISGHRTETVQYSKDIILPYITYLSIDGARKRRIRSGIDLFLRAGDVCAYPGGSLTVGEITYYVSTIPISEMMEVLEA